MCTPEHEQNKTEIRYFSIKSLSFRKLKENEHKHLPLVKGNTTPSQIQLI